MKGKKERERECNMREGKEKLVCFVPVMSFLWNSVIYKEVNLLEHAHI